MVERERILIAYDGSESADAALADLRLAGLPLQVEAVVMSVGEMSLSPPTSFGLEGEVIEMLPSTVQETQELAARACNHIKTEFPDWDVVPEARIGSVTVEIIEKADNWKPGLLVVGSNGRSAIARSIVGSVSQKLVTVAHCPVRVARGRSEESVRPVRIIIGLDNLPDSKTAVELLSHRSWPAGSEVRLVTATNSEGQKEIAYVQEFHSSAMAPLEASGLSVSSVITKGDPKRVLLEQAEKFSADSIFVGAKGKDRLSRFFLGSVAIAVVNRARCSVEVVR